ncbi:MAG: hypothetical protein IKN65_02985 [Clostridia bacterium]|nr:hypothetical protein [Clostridia bacterium]
MKKMTRIMLTTLFVFMCLFTPVYATSTVYAASTEQSSETLKSESTGKLLEIKKHELTTIEDYKEKYGSDTYGVTAYILDRIRIYSIPLVFIGLALSAIYQFVVGLKKLDVRDKGFNGMIAIITIGVICQILPIVFAIVVTSTGNQ